MVQGFRKMVDRFPSLLLVLFAIWIDAVHFDLLDAQDGAGYVVLAVGPGKLDHIYCASVRVERFHTTDTPILF